MPPTDRGLSNRKAQRLTTTTSVLQPSLYNAVPLTPESLVIFKVPVLKALAQHYGLRYGGTKSQLIERLVAFASSRAALNVSSHLSPSGKLSCVPHDLCTVEVSKYKRQVPSDSPALSALFPFHPELRHSPHFFNCFCRGRPLTFPTTTISCAECGEPFHEHCMNISNPDPTSGDPVIFLCPYCRFKRMDPFHPLVQVLWMTYFHPSMPQVTVDADQASYCVFLTFSLDAKNLHLWRKSNQHVIVRCVRLYPSQQHHDLELHEWPRTLTIKVNEHIESIEAPRPDHKRRDSPMFLTQYLRPSENCIELTMTSTWIAMKSLPMYALGVLLCDSLDVPALMKSICMATDHSYENHLARVVSLLNPKLAEKGEEDDVLCIEKVYRFKLTCSITLSRLVTPGRGKLCKHLQCFDLESFIYVTKRSKAFNNRWKCPECSRLVRPEMLVKDLFVSRILEQTQHLPGDIVEVSPEGHWKLLPPTAPSFSNDPLTTPCLFKMETQSETEVTALQHSQKFNVHHGDPHTPISVEDSSSEAHEDLRHFSQLQSHTPPPTPLSTLRNPNHLNQSISEMNRPSIECIDLSSSSSSSSSTPTSDDDVPHTTHASLHSTHPKRQSKGSDDTVNDPTTVTPTDVTEKRCKKRKRKRQNEKLTIRKNNRHTQTSGKKQTLQFSTPSSASSSCADPTLSLDKKYSSDNIFILEAANMFLMMRPYSSTDSSSALHPHTFFPLQSDSRLHSTESASTPCGLPQNEKFDHVNMLWSPQFMNYITQDHLYNSAIYPPPEPPISSTSCPHPTFLPESTVSALPLNRATNVHSPKIPSLPHTASKNKISQTPNLPTPPQSSPLGPEHSSRYISSQRPSSLRHS